MGLHLHGRIRSADTGPVTIATDGSVARAPNRHYRTWMFATGWGYLSTNGTWGVGNCPQPSRIAGRDRPVVAELRAIWHAAGRTLRDQRHEVWTDSMAAIQYIETWKTGIMRMPDRYVGSLTHTPRLLVLARAVAANPGNLTVRHVHGHRGQALNEAADRLAHLGRHWGEQQLTEEQVRVRALWICEQHHATGRLREVAA